MCFFPNLARSDDDIEFSIGYSHILVRIRKNSRTIGALQPLGIFYKLIGVPMAHINSHLFNKLA
jgi:hypothetical protein